MLQIHRSPGRFQVVHVWIHSGCCHQLQSTSWSEATCRSFTATSRVSQYWLPVDYKSTDRVTTAIGLEHQIPISGQQTNLGLAFQEAWVLTADQSGQGTALGSIMRCIVSNRIQRPCLCLSQMFEAWWCLEITLQALASCLHAHSEAQSELLTMPL